MPFRGNYPYQESLERDGKLILELTELLGYPQLASELDEVFRSTLVSALPEAARTGSRDAFELPRHRDLRRGAFITMLARIKRKMTGSRP